MSYVLCTHVKPISSVMSYCEYTTARFRFIYICVHLFNSRSNLDFNTTPVILGPRVRDHHRLYWTTHSVIGNRVEYRSGACTNDTRSMYRFTFATLLIPLSFPINYLSRHFLLTSWIYLNNILFIIYISKLMCIIVINLSKPGVLHQRTQYHICTYIYAKKYSKTFCDKIS